MSAFNFPTWATRVLGAKDTPAPDLATLQERAQEIFYASPVTVETIGPDVFSVAAEPQKRKGWPKGKPRK